MKIIMSTFFKDDVYTVFRLVLFNTQQPAGIDKLQCYRATITDDKTFSYISREVYYNNKR